MTVRQFVKKLNIGTSDILQVFVCLGSGQVVSSVPFSYLLNPDESYFYSDYRISSFSVKSGTLKIFVKEHK